MIRLIDDPVGFLRLALGVYLPRWQERQIRKLAKATQYQKATGLRAEVITEQINEALKEMNE